MMEVTRRTLLIWVPSVVIASSIIAYNVGQPEAGSGTTGSIKVVPAGSPAEVPDQPNLAPPAAAPTPPVVDFGPLTVVERNIALHSRSRDDVWAPAAEASLTHAVNAIDGIKVDRVHCASGACELIAIYSGAANGDQASAVALLQDGPVQRAYAAMGFVANGHMTINVDDRGALHFTQYLGITG